MLLIGNYGVNTGAQSKFLYNNPNIAEQELPWRWCGVAQQTRGSAPPPRSIPVGCVSCARLCRQLSLPPAPPITLAP